MPYYGVWSGRVPGIYNNWKDCQTQIASFKGAVFKKLMSTNLEDAKKEFDMNLQPIENFLTVDGACNGTQKGGLCEYQGVMFPSRDIIFRSKVYENGTNNIAEFLGLVEGIKYFISRNEEIKIYSDSITALAWVRDCKANTCAKNNPELNTLIAEADTYLRENKEKIKNARILKWYTSAWGEIPADFNRK